MSDNRDTRIPCHLWPERFGLPRRVRVMRCRGGGGMQGWVLQGAGCSGEGHRLDFSSPGDGMMDFVSIPGVQPHSCWARAWPALPHPSCTRDILGKALGVFPAA